MHLSNFMVVTFVTNNNRFDFANYIVAAICSKSENLIILILGIIVMIKKHRKQYLTRT